MQTRIYVVLNKQSGERRLVEAISASQAIRHCVQNIYEAKPGSPKDIAGAMSEGLKVEQANQTNNTNEGEQV